MKWIVLLVSLLSMTACSNQRKFIPAGQELSGAAHLIGDSDPPKGLALTRAHCIFIDVVDGTRVRGVVKDWPSIDVYLMPGAHIVDVSYHQNGVEASGRFSVDVEAGKTYFIHHKVTGYHVRLWITEGEYGTALIGRSLPTG